MGMRHGPAQGWEQCPGSGQYLHPVGLNWWSCPTCHWVGWKKRTDTPQPTPVHQRPIPQPPTTLF
jgi:hypothetical protein